MWDQFSKYSNPFSHEKNHSKWPKITRNCPKSLNWKILKNPRRFFFYWTKLLKKVSIFISPSMKLAIFRMRISKIDHSALDFTTHSSQSAQHSPLPLSGEKYAFCWVTLCMHGAPQSAHRCAFIIYRPVNIYWPNLISDQMYLCIIYLLKNKIEYSSIKTVSGESNCTPKNPWCKIHMVHRSYNLYAFAQWAGIRT